MLFNAGPNTKIASVRYTIHQITNNRVIHSASRDYLYGKRTGLDGLLCISNIAPYNEKKKKKEKKPIMNRNEPLTKCKPKREKKKKKKKKINACRGFRDSFNVQGFLPFL